MVRIGGQVHIRRGGTVLCRVIGNNQKLLVERAVTLYDGRAFRKEPDDSDILVCKECGSRQLEIQAWINANTDERIRYVHDDNNGLWCDGKWCEECGVQVFSVLRRSSHKDAGLVGVVRF